VWSLRDEAPRLVPTGYCYFGHPDITEHFFCVSDSNGNAAGNTLEEAVLQGLMELVERDSVAIWWYQRLRRPAVDLDAFGEPYFDAVREYYERLGRSLWVLDLTTDLGIPAFAGVSRRRDGPTEDIVLGFGAHVDPRIAAMRALTEVNQFLPAVTEIRDDGTTNYWIDDPDALAWWTASTVETDPYLLPDDTVGHIDPGMYRGLSTDDLASDVHNCVERIGAAGHDIVVLDQTRPDIELNVVKVMSPGLRHFWRRLGPGRLYDVPKLLGWSTVEADEDGLNPRSIFF
jgi:oxazoline/thiazoline synthase